MLKARATSAEGNARLEYYRQIDELQSMRNSAAEKPDELRKPAMTPGRTSKLALTARGTLSDVLLIPPNHVLNNQRTGRAR